MSFHDREESILKHLYEKGSLKNSELAKLLYVSPATLRRDLKALEEKELIVREYGTCRLSKKLRDERTLFQLQEQQHSSAKMKIARKAVKLIENGNIILLDGSSTAYNIIHLLEGFEDLLVITNNVKTSYALGTVGIDNIIAGGHMIKNTFSCVGETTLNIIRNYNADIMFFSCKGINEEGYLTDTFVELDVVRREMMRHAKKKVLLCAKEKFGKNYMHNLCHISEMDEVICEEELPEYILKYLK